MLIPVEAVDLETVKRQLTVKYRPMGEDVDIVVETYRIDGDCICVPRQYGIQLCNRLQLEFLDDTSEGQGCAHWPSIPTPRDYQEDPIEEIHRAFDNYYDVVFRARTAFGKTISSMIIASAYACPVLVVVDQNNLLEQWMEVLTKPGLFGFRREDVGIIQGDTLIYEDCTVTIAMAQTLRNRNYGPEVMDYFGFCVLDEMHVYGAPTYAQPMLTISAARRLSVSATTRRRDAGQKVLDYNFGPVRVAADAEHDRSAVYFVRNPTVYSWYANTSPKIGRILSEIAEDPARNLRLAELIMFLYETGRDTLVMSDRVEHLAALRDLLHYMGLEDGEAGLYVDSGAAYKIAKDPTPARIPIGWERDTDYTPVSVQVVRKKVPGPALKAIKETARIILSTYGKFKKGVDEARLSGGIDTTPKSEASQVHGRIKRGKVDKLPIWITILDENNYRLVHWFAQRVEDYIRDNVDFYELNEDGSLTEWNADELLAYARSRATELKSMRIEPDNCGGNMLLTATTAKRLKALQERSTANQILSRRRG